MSVHLKTAPPTQGAHDWQTHLFIFYFNLLCDFVLLHKNLYTLLSSPLRPRGYRDASFLSPGIGNSFLVATCHCEREMRKLILGNTHRQLFQFEMQEEVQNPRMFCPFSPKNRPEKEGDWAAGDSAGGTIFRKREQKIDIFCFLIWHFPGRLPAILAESNILQRFLHFSQCLSVQLPPD